MRLKRLAALLLLAVGAPAFLQATTFEKMSTAQLAAESSDIVVGNVTNLRSVWVDRTLVTLVTVSVSESIKGSGASEVTVVVPGGIDTSRAVHVAMLYPGAPMMSLSEEVVLFLNSAGSPVENAYAIVGFSQGRFSVMRDGDSIVLAQGLTGGPKLELAALKSTVREQSQTGEKGGKSHE
jgi:hypothetical protein